MFIPSTVPQIADSLRENPAKSPDMSPCILTVTFFMLFFLVIALFIFDTIRPDAFSRPNQREQRLLEETEANAKKNERTPLIPRERPSDDDEARRPPPFWPQAKLSPWSVRY